VADRDDATAATKREGPKWTAAGERSDQLSRGTLVGRYVVLDVLGEGGMGVVYAAYDPELDRKVAIKLLQAAHGGSQSGGQAWLLREAQAMARLSHPNVIAVYDVGTLPNDCVFVAMELVEGETLRAWLKAAPRTWREIVPVMQAAGAGLAAAHAAGLVHRDFKPENVLVGRDGRVRVLDFGLARLRLEGDASEDVADARASEIQIEARSSLAAPLTRTGAVVGTPAYMAPEIFGGHTADARTDQFSFGVALYEALYRERPFTREQLLERTAVAPTPPASADVPVRIQRVALRAIALDPAQRFASMADLLVELGRDPRAARRRIAIGMAIAATCGGLAVGAVALRGEPASQLCTGSDAKLAGVWDAEVRSALEAAFRRTRQSFAEDAIRGTERVLDGYAADWVVMHREACEATRVRGEQSEEVLTLRMECLDSRLAELKALAGLFDDADAPLVAKAVSTARSLSSLTDCGDVAALRAPDPLPKDPVARARVSALQAQLAEGRALQKASHYREALALADRIAGDAKQLGHLPTLAELWLLEGQTKHLAAHDGKGDPDLIEAVRAADAGRADRIRVEALTTLIDSATELQHFDSAHERARDALAALARLGNDWEQKLHVLQGIWLLATRQNDTDKMLATVHDMRELVEHEQHRTDTLEYAIVLSAEGQTMAHLAKDEEAVADLRKALAINEAAAGPRTAQIAQHLQMISAEELVLGRTDAAIADARRAVDIDEAIFGPENRETARSLDELARATMVRGDPTAALAIYQRTDRIVAHALGEDSAERVQSLASIAESLQALHRSSEAIPYIDHALAIATSKYGLKNTWTTWVLETRVDILRDSGKIDAALATARQALAIEEEMFGHDHAQLYSPLFALAKALVVANQPRDADQVFQRALHVGAPSDDALHELELAAAGAAWDAGDHRRAMELARKARDGYAALGPDHHDAVVQADAWLKRHSP